MMSLYRGFPSLILFLIATIHAISAFDEARVPRKLMKIATGENAIKPYVSLTTDYEHRVLSGGAAGLSTPPSLPSSLPLTKPQTHQSLLGLGGESSVGKKTTLPTPPPTPRGINKMSTASVSYDAKLKIKIPHPGASGDSMLAAALCIAIISTLLPPTILRTVPRAVRFATIPFWAGGSSFAKRAFFDPYLSTTLSIRKGKWDITRRFLGIPIKRTKGKAAEVKGAECEVAGLIHGIPKNQLRLLLDKKQDVVFGMELADKELQTLEEYINGHVQKMRSVTDGVARS